MFSLPTSNNVVVLIICPKLIFPYRLCFQCCSHLILCCFLMCFITSLEGHYFVDIFYSTREYLGIAACRLVSSTSSQFIAYTAPHVKSMFQVLCVFCLSDEFWKEDTIVSMSRWVLRRSQLRIWIYCVFPHQLCFRIRFTLHLIHTLDGYQRFNFNWFRI
jgi:hypothetical protein